MEQSGEPLLGQCSNFLGAADENTSIQAATISFDDHTVAVTVPVETEGKKA